jgi:UDP-2,3-diacylglucosamine pyrophosphatase LpxH
VSKYKIVVSDLHLGKGRVLPDGSINILEDFIADRKWVEYLSYYTTGKFFEAEIELILLGDIFNTIQVDYMGYMTPIVTETIAVAKLKSCIDGHPEFMQALRDFVACPNKKITYLVGNHDVDFIWDGCKELFQAQVGAPVQFKHFSYQVDGVYFEHGQQYETVNRLDPKKIFITRGLKEPILNLPWGSHFVINFVIPIKHERPAIDKVRPLKHFVRWSLMTDFFWTLKTLARAALYFFATRFSKSLYRTTNIVTTLKIFRELSMHPELSDAAKDILEQNPDVHTVVMGHTHTPHYSQFEDGREYFNTGTWTEVTSLDWATLGKYTRYTYLLVDYSKNALRPHAYLREWRGRWHEESDAL